MREVASVWMLRCGRGARVAGRWVGGSGKEGEVGLRPGGSAHARPPARSTWMEVAVGWLVGWLVGVE